MVIQRLASRYMSLSAKESAKDRKASVVRSGGIDKELHVASSRKPFYDARVLYCVAAAMGHNKVTLLNAMFDNLFPKAAMCLFLFEDGFFRVAENFCPYALDKYLTGMRSVIQDTL